MPMSSALSAAVAAATALAAPAAAAAVTVTTTLPAASFCAGCSDVGAGIADTVFAPATLPADLPAGRRLFPAVDAAEVAIPAYLRPGGLLHVFDGSDRQIDGRVAGFALDGTLAVIPEPRVWALLIAGYGMIGLALRRRGWARRVAV